MKSLFAMRFLLLLALLVPVLRWPVLAAAVVKVYSNSFNGEAGTSYPEWSSSTIAYSGTGNPPTAKI